MSCCKKSGLAGHLDEAVLQTMEAAQPEMVREICDEISRKGDIRNPSAFISRALRDYPFPATAPKRPGQQHIPQMPPQKRFHAAPADPLAAHPAIVQQLDDAAREKLRAYPDQNRVRTVLAEMEA